MNNKTEIEKQIEKDVQQAELDKKLKEWNLKQTKLQNFNEEIKQKKKNKRRAAKARGNISRKINRKKTLRWKKKQSKFREWFLKNVWFA